VWSRVDDAYSRANLYLCCRVVLLSIFLVAQELGVHLRGDSWARSRERRGVGGGREGERRGREGERARETERKGARAPVERRARSTNSREHG
jgi:hypothetical protein